MSGESLPDERALIERARRLELDNRFVEAKDIINRVLHTNPGNAEAKRALSRLQHADPYKPKVENIYETPTSESAVHELVRQNQQLMQQVQVQQSGQPVVNITNQAAFVASPRPAAREERNNAAFIVGVIAGIFGLLGLAHLFNGKVGSGLALIFLGTPIYGLGVMVYHPGHWRRSSCHTASFCDYLAERQERSQVQLTAFVAPHAQITLLLVTHESLQVTKTAAIFAD